MEFEWDPAKVISNLEKHRVAFTEAMTIFADPDHSEHEARFLSIGRSELGRLLVVAYTERGSRTRLINAREATPKETRDYESGQRG